jgi:hypothetical protein
MIIGSASLDPTYKIARDKDMPMSLHQHSFMVVLLSLLLLSSTAHTQPAIQIDTPMPPPEWAVMERQLLDANTLWIEMFTEKYIDPSNGYFEAVVNWGGGDGPDDAMENVYNWPLLHVLGGPKSTLETFKFIWEGHIRQYTEAGMFYREFNPAFDWEHNGEGYAGFNLLPLADPEDVPTRQRMVRFANFYTGRDKTAPNWDAEHKIIRGTHNGSKGPRFGPKMDNWPDSEKFVSFSRGDDHLRGDYPMNLITTALTTNAYMLTGDEHYRDWTLEYANVWRERAVANDGMIPSNVGLGGKVGEYYDGKWYAGFYGWDFWFGGWGILGRGVRIGFSNAYLLSGDARILDMLRRQGDHMLANRVENGGQLVFLNKYGADGWYQEALPGAHYSARSFAFEGLFADIYTQTFEQQDLDRLYDASQLDDTRRRNEKTWFYEYEDGHYDAGNEVTWIDFLQGRHPEYPKKALGEAFERLRIAGENLRRDETTPDTRRVDTPHSKGKGNLSETKIGVIGAATGALVNLTMGGMQPLWSGGLLFCQLRYFDPVNRMPGLPLDVGALVTYIDAEKVKVTLVNINQSDAREIIVQTGGYGEHQCESVEVNGNRVSVDHRFFPVQLAPGTGAELVIYRTRMANTPTVAFPWHSETVTK